MKKITQNLIIVLLLVSSTITAQDNIFIGRDFWKTNPNIEQIEQKIKEGNNPSQLNRFGFDAVVYALLENADEAVIKHLLTKEGNDVNKLTHDGRTYIFWAAYKNNMPIVKHLLKNGAKMDVIDDKGYSVLNFTAVAGVENSKLYDLLIAYGANPKTEKTPKGANALLLITPSLKDFKMIDYFTNKGLDINSTDKNGNGVFDYAAQKDNRIMLDKLLKKGVTKGKNTMLFATRGSRKGYNSLDYFKYLEGLGISPNVIDKDGDTPLIKLAYSNDDLETLNHFINKGVDVNQTNKDGNNALLYASYRNSLDAVKLFASKTKDINHKNKDGKSALTNSLRNKLEVIEFLLDKGADINVVDTKGNDMAYYLFNTYSSKNIEDFTKKLNLLTNKGLVVTNTQKDGNTLYHLAVTKQSLPMLNYIKKYKININAKNKKGLTALQQSVMTAKNNEIIKYLIAEGANKTIKTGFDETLYDLAQENEALKNIDISFLK